MIKGVNKKIVEINNPQSIYFEKAILYVRPDAYGVSERQLSKEADAYLDSIIRRSKNRITISGKAMAFAVISTAILAVSLILIFF